MLQFVEISEETINKLQEDSRESYNRGFRNGLKQRDEMRQLKHEDKETARFLSIQRARQSQPNLY